MALEFILRENVLTEKHCETKNKYHIEYER